MLISQQKKNYDYFKGKGQLYSRYFDSPNQVNFNLEGGQRYPHRFIDAPHYRSFGQDGKLYRYREVIPLIQIRMVMGMASL